jgi:hypothetical protein
MTEKGTAVIDDLLQSLEDAGFVVVQVGARYRVTNPAGGAPAFIPKRLPKGANFALVVAGLAKIGFDVAAAEAKREKARQERMASDRAAAAKAMQIAADAAAERTARAAVEFVAPIVTDEPGAHRLAALAESRRQPRTEIIDFTPQFARELLTANRFYEPGATHAGHCNRRFRPALAKAYSEAMLRGEWVLTEQGIGQDIDGELTNGQHRLAAIVLAGETKPDIQIPMQFTYDLPREARDVVDSGLRRTLGDNLAMHGEADANVLGAALRLVQLYDRTPWNSRVWREARISYDQCRQMLEAEPALREWITYGRKVAIGARMLASGTCAFFAIASREWPHDVLREFGEQLRTGVGQDDPGNPILAMRNLATNQQVRRTRRESYEHMALAIRTFQLWVEGHRRVVIRWDDDEFPRLHGPSTSSGLRTRNRGATGS